MKLEVGMYVITTDRKQIGKITSFCECKMCKERGFYEPVIDVPDMFITISDKERKFHGYKFYDNLFSLVKIGDYVNGYPVDEIIEYEDNTRAIVIADDNKSIIWEESSQYIKSIVTREQFESMSYKVGE